LIGLGLGGIAFGSCQANRASDATRQLQEALAAHTDSLTVWTATRHALTAELQGLRADSAVLRISLVRTQASRDAAQRDAQTLATRLQTAGDTAGARVVRVADSTAQAERAGCSLVIQNCQARAENAEERAAGDSILLVQTALLLKQTGDAWRTEQRKNAPGFLGLRAFWKARTWTVPLAAVTTLLLLKK
jgi:septal ring factor EnvC (AmiA/AmiB activator)